MYSMLTNYISAFAWRIMNNLLLRDCAAQFVISGSPSKDSGLMRYINRNWDKADKYHQNCAFAFHRDRNDPSSEPNSIVERRSSM